VIGRRLSRWLVPGPLRDAARRWLRGTVGRIVLWVGKRRRAVPPPDELIDLEAALEREARAARRAVADALRDLERSTRLAPGTVTRVVVTGDDAAARTLLAAVRDRPPEPPETTEKIVWRRGG
jgi:hypothetical protein